MLEIIVKRCRRANWRRRLRYIPPTVAVPTGNGNGGSSRSGPVVFIHQHHRRPNWHRRLKFIPGAVAASMSVPAAGIAFVQYSKITRLKDFSSFVPPKSPVSTAENVTVDVVTGYVSVTADQNTVIVN